MRISDWSSDVCSSDLQLVEMKRCRSNGLCCGAGGAQLFKEPEPGNKDINVERVEEALETQPEIIAAACTFCMTMLRDVIKAKETEHDVEGLDIAEITTRHTGLWNNAVTKTGQAT